MPTREQVLRIIRSGLDYQAAGRSLGVPAGRAYLIATGIPADGSDSLSPEDLEREGVVKGSTQHLANPVAANPTVKGHVDEWMRRRAASDTPMVAAARADDPDPGPMASEDEQPDVLHELTRHHNEVTGLIKQLKAVPDDGPAGGDDLRRRMAALIAARLAAHEGVEQEVLWPAVASHLHDGAAVSERARRQEEEVSSAVATLADTGGTDAGSLSDLSTVVARHVAFEDRVFLDLRQAIPDEERRRLGAELRRSTGAG